MVRVISMKLVGNFAVSSISLIFMTYDKSPIGQKRKRVATFELFSIGLVGSAKPL